MILGSDSHTRYGSYGCMGVGEGGGELVKQLLENTYDVAAPEVVMVYLEGKPRKGVGPQDVALSIIGKVYANGNGKLICSRMGVCSNNCALRAIQSAYLIQAEITESSRRLEIRFIKMVSAVHLLGK